MGRWWSYIRGPVCQGSRSRAARGAVVVVLGIDGENVRLCGSENWKFYVAAQTLCFRQDGGCCCPMPIHSKFSGGGVVQEHSLRDQDADSERGVAPLGDLHVELVVLCFAEQHHT